MKPIMIRLVQKDQLKTAIFMPFDFGLIVILDKLRPRTS